MVQDTSLVTALNRRTWTLTAPSPPTLSPLHRKYLSRLRFATKWESKHVSNLTVIDLGLYRFLSRHGFYIFSILRLHYVIISSIHVTYALSFRLGWDSSTRDDVILTHPLKKDKHRNF